MKVYQILNLCKYQKILTRNVCFASRSIVQNCVIKRLESTFVKSVHDDCQGIRINNINLSKYITKIEEEYNRLLENKDSNSRNLILKIEPIIRVLNKRKEILENLQTLKELENDEDEAFRELAKSDVKKFNETLLEVEEELILALMPTPDEDFCNDIVLEINAGVGGQEAMLFAKELFDMYLYFSEYKGWQVEIAELVETDLGGIRHGCLLISGHAVFQFFKYEAGVHRVQRIPATERGGRIHTSTVSVLALPQPTYIQIDLHQKDLRIETKKASGAGGQHVNTTDSAVRITHIPTGISVECQVDRSQIKNRRIAMTKLRTLLYQKELDSQTAQIDATKKSQVRTNFRNEKIRTYNFNQDRITDHRLQGNIHNMKGFFEGNTALEDLITRLDKQCRLEKLLDNVNKMSN